MVQKRVRGALGIAALSVVVGCNESTPAPEAEKPTDAAKAATLENGARVILTDGQKVAQFVTGLSIDLPAIPAAGPKALNEAALAPVVSSLAPMFRLEPANLVFKKAHTDRQGDSHYRYAVKHNNLQVLGGELIVHARNGKVFAANTNVRSDLRAELKATIAGDIARSSVDSDRETLEGWLTDKNPELVYWRVDDELRLVYKVVQHGNKADGTPVRDWVLVDARNGDVMLRIPQIKEGLVRSLHDGNNTTTLPGALVRAEGAPAVADPVVNTNYDHLETVYNCYNELFGRDSIDNNGGTLISTVHHRVNYVNAFWDGTQMVYGDGDGVTASNLANSLDVTAHELTHAVTDNESDLIYSGESGGLNESMSDVFGAVCEWYGDGADEVSPRHWLIGDDVWTPSIPNDALRYMNDPATDGDSLDHYHNYVPGTGVHYSSGISNLAFYLLSQGGTHPRGKSTIVVQGIGIEKAAQIFYKTNTMLVPTSNFEAAKAVSEQAAADLGYDAATIESVSNAWKAVGVSVPVPPPPTDPIVKDTPVVVEGGQNEKKYFEITVPEGAYNLRFTMSGGTGDADMYVRYNSAPTSALYDCRPYTSGNNEVCTFAAPQHGKWYVMLNGYRAYSGVSLTVTWEGGFVPIESGIAVENLTGAAGSSQVFILDVPERRPGQGKNNIYIQTGEGKGNPDLYVKRGGAPSHADYDCRSVKDHQSEKCNLINAPAGRYYIEVYGAKGGYEGIVLIGSFLEPLPR
ncbi:M4 family metallopeptidase [Corallococcus macrosporus]|uniref:Peptidase n=1 Tax=Corallococcus macrosporus DSM 14697 TaxID=1189310 RepID=A0A250K3C9_9BACT|nr:M4 family metallopeptidase [Corallococcus macrosporus]ATB50237.1 peptidase [Corallococcus macrosporus DSM 14697]